MQTKSGKNQEILEGKKVGTLFTFHSVSMYTSSFIYQGMRAFYEDILDLGCLVGTFGYFLLVMLTLFFPQV